MFEMSVKRDSDAHTASRESQISARVGDNGNYETSDMTWGSTPPSLTPNLTWDIGRMVHEAKEPRECEPSSSLASRS